MSGEELKWRQLAHHQLMSQHGPHFSTNLGKLVIFGISDVVTASVYSEKTRMKKMIMIIIISMDKSQESAVFGGRQKLTSAMKLRLEKWW